MATTPNYGFIMPDPTDLVTDLPADFEIFGDEVDLRVKALNPETTEGDLAYRGATADAKERLAIGTAGQVLAVNAGEDAPEWIPAPGAVETAYTLLTSSTTTGASTVTLSFTACSDLLLSVHYVYAAGAEMRVRFNGSTSGYDIFNAQIGQSGGLQAPFLGVNADAFNITSSPNGGDKGFTMLINGAKKVGFPTMYCQAYFTTGGGTPTTRTSSGIHNVNGPITSISFVNNFGNNFTTMNAKVYGRA